jgi:hypothetical protein
LAAILSAGILSACGGSGASPTARAEFLARANAICASGLRKARQLQQPKSAAGLLPFTERARPIVAKIVAELAAVTPPASSRAAYGKYLAKVTEEVKAIGQLVVALRGHDIRLGQSALGELNSNVSNAEASALGLSQCARTVAPSGGG